MCTPKAGLCGPLWSNLPNEKWAKVKLVDSKYIQIIGDFADPISSCNDPLFGFHHANVDRNFEMWMRLNLIEGKTNFYNYPISGYAKGVNLNDAIGVNDTFYKVLVKHFGNRLHTTKTVIISSYMRKFPYRYDTASPHVASTSTQQLKQVLCIACFVFFYATLKMFFKQNLYTHSPAPKSPVLIFET